jgi:DNA-binding MarR family transcriptional regulator
MRTVIPRSRHFDFSNAPGHLIRRAHQVSVALFMEAAADADITQVQFAILNALIDQPGMDQVRLAQAVALDPATSGSVIGRLEKKGWIIRQRDEADRRRWRLTITDAGRQTVASLIEPIGRSQSRLLAPLQEAERQLFCQLLRKVTCREAWGELDHDC